MKIRTHGSGARSQSGRIELARTWWLGLGLAWLLAGCVQQSPRPPAAPAPTPAVATASLAVPGVTPERLHAQYWIDRLHEPGTVVLDTAAIAAQNQRLVTHDANVRDLANLPVSLERDAILDLIAATSSLPQGRLFDTQGEPLVDSVRQDLQDALATDTIAATVKLEFGLVTRRSNLRSFPTEQRVFSRPGNTDIDRFQETALFPGTPVAIVHASRDGQWNLVISRLYSAWIKTDAIAIGPRDEVFDYTQRSPYLIVTGSQVRTVFTPEAPALSELVLDMGVRLPLLANWPDTRLVNGQLPYASHVVALPVRGPQGELELQPALIPRNTDTGTAYLPLTRANLITQAFKFLGERYGWGHSYGTRDCSGFVSEIYRSFGVEMPRNTSAQAISPAFSRIALGPDDDHEKRLAIVRDLDVGDLIYIPGHVMMVIGHEDGETWLIHDTTGTHYRAADGTLVSVPLNQVAVTPLLGLLGDSGTPYVDFITNIQRIRLVDHE